jgi:hypothetical protein
VFSHAGQFITGNNEFIKPVMKEKYESRENKEVDWAWGLCHNKLWNCCDPSPQVTTSLRLQYLHPPGRSSFTPHADSQPHVLSELCTRLYSVVFSFVCNKSYGIALLKVQVLHSGPSGIRPCVAAQVAADVSKQRIALTFKGRCPRIKPSP